MRQIDEVHDAENERQSRRQQKQQQTELQSVQELFDDKQHGYFETGLKIERRKRKQRQRVSAPAVLDDRQKWKPVLRPARP
jgi:hypothetical protein